MLRAAALYLALGLWMAGLSSPAWAAFQVPPLASPVVDQAGIIDSRTKVAIDQVLRAIRDKGGPQINVLTVESLDGEPIETVSIRVTDAWKLGDKKRDDGALLLVSLKDKKIRIEVGQGLEGVLTDADSKRIIDDLMVPYFREGRPSDGIAAGVGAILRKVGAVAEDSTALGEVGRKKKKSMPFSDLGVILIFIFIIIVMSFTRAGRRALWHSNSGWGGGGIGRGGFGGGGGGWSGGGGGFSGGGASGGW